MAHPRLTWLSWRSVNLELCRAWSKAMTCLGGRGGSVHGGAETGHRARVGRALCKALLPQKELPHIAVIAVKYSGISVAY